MKLQKSIDLFFAWGIHNYSRRTAILYTNIARQFASSIDVMNHTNLCDIGVMTHIIPYAEQLRKRGIAEGTVNLHLISIRQLWRFCENVLCDNYSISLNMRHEAIPVRKVKANSHKPITPEEWDTIEHVFQSTTIKGIRDQLLMRLMYATGLRVSEVIDLNVGDIDLINNEIVAITRKRRDTANHRTVPYTPDVTRIMKVWLPILATLHNDKQRALFVGLRGGGRLTTRQVERIFKEYCQRAKITGKRTPHSMRHAFGQRLASAQMYQPYLQQLMGHSLPASSQVYYNIKNENVRKAYHEAITITT